MEFQIAPFCLLLVLLLVIKLALFLPVFQDPEGDHARRAMQRGGGQFAGGHGPDVAPGIMNLPPSILNNPNIPPEVISNLQAGRLGSTIFVANVSLFYNSDI